MAIDVLLADGRKVVREALTVLLRQQDDIRVVGDAAEVAGAIKLVRALPVQVIILSAAPRDRRAIDSLLRAAKRRRARVVVLLLGAQHGGARELVKAGVAGCVTRDAAADELVRAIRTVHAGKVYLSPSLVEEIVSGLGSPSTTSAREPRLSPREQMILQTHRPRRYDQGDRGGIERERQNDRNAPTAPDDQAGPPQCGGAYQVRHFARAVAPRTDKLARAG